MNGPRTHRRLFARTRLPVAGVLLIAVMLAGCADPGGSETRPTATPRREATSTPPARRTPTPTQEQSSDAGIPAGAERATVEWIIDGDTLDVILRDGSEERLRLIGVDAPEQRPSDSEPAQCFGSEATGLLIKWIPQGTVVWLETDQTERDRFGRLLRYLWAEEDGEAILINEKLVREGAAIARRFPPDTTYATRFERAQAAAEADGAGLWGACGGVVALEARVAPTATSARMGIASGADQERAGCDPAYPTVCIPPSPPDLDCKQISFTRFQVLPPDPHRFDLDFDGIGCEGAPP